MNPGIVESVLFEHFIRTEHITIVDKVNCFSNNGTREIYIGKSINHEEYKQQTKSKD